MPGGLLERDVELGQIAAALGEGSGVLVVEGEAGIGKSALLAWGVELARGQGWRALRARGGLLERDFGYGVARQLFEAPLRHATDGERRRWLSGAAELAAPALGLAQAGLPADVEDPAFAAQHGLYWLAANLAGEVSLALVVDDLQWADLASLRWLVYLARRLDGVSLVVLGAWRTGEAEAPVELLGQLGGDRLVPSGLSVAAAGELVGRRLGRECDGPTAQAVHGSTGGNPLLLTELAHSLDEDTSLPLDVARVVELGGRAVARHVSSRTALLPPAAREVVAAAAVLGADVAPRQLGRLTELSLEQVREGCDRLVSARILAGREEFEFVHPLVRAAIYDELRPARRAALHRRAADVLDAEGLVDRAAVHLLASERTGDPKVVGRLVAAADRALGRGAVEEAIVLLRRALEEPPLPGERYLVLIRLAGSEYLAASEEAAIRHARAALELAGDPEDQEAAVRLLAQLVAFADRRGDDLEVLAAAASALRERAPERALRVDVERASWSLLLPRPPRGIRREVVALAEQVERGSLDERTLRGLLAVLDATRGTQPAAETADMALAALGDGQLVAELSGTGFYPAVIALTQCERLDQGDEWLARRWDRFVTTGSRAEVHATATLRARIAWLRGDLAAAVEEARLALREGERRRYGFYSALAVTQLVAALAEQGEFDEAEAALSAHGIAEGTTFGWYDVIPVRATVALARGELRRARAQLAAAPPERSLFPLQMAPCEVAVALAGGEREEALDRARAMLAVAEVFGAAGKLGIARRLLGLCTGGEEGIRLLRAAVELLERSPLRLELALALIDLGAALRRERRRVEARDPLSHGLDLAQRCGATVLSERAEDELRASGARPRRLVLTGVGSLTPSELRVARLAAEGRSNPEIAQALFVTVRTVETHLGHVFQKLDLTSRDQLPAALSS
jgi:DNA-binding CsgD family transcriptional regulator